MRGLLVLFALGVAVSAIIPHKDRDIKINIYDVVNSLNFAAPLTSYLDYLNKGKDVKFTEDLFHHYTEEKIREFIVVYKPTTENYLHGYYVRAENVSQYGEEYSNAVRPFHDYLRSGEYYGLTPYTAKQIAPEYFNAPLRKIFYKHYSDIDLHHAIPLVFLVPRREVIGAALQDKVIIAETEFYKEGAHYVHEHFPHNVGKILVRREAETSDLTEKESPYSYAFSYDPSDAHYKFYTSYLRGYPFYADSFMRTAPSFYDESFL